MKKRGLSIRYKILLLLTAIPALTLAAYLVLALRIFESDKIAYVFDATSNVSGTLATQIKTQLNSVLITCKPIFQDYLESFNEQGQRSFSATSDRLFRQEPLIDLIAAYRPTEQGSFEKSGVLEKDAGLSQLWEQALGADLDAAFLEAMAQGRVLKAPFGDDRVVMFEKISDEVRKENTIFLIGTRLSETAEMFKTSLSQRLYLISRDGRILFGPGEGGTLGNLKEKLSLSFLANPKAQVVQGAETAKDPQGKEILASYARAGFGDLIVVSTVPKATALGAMQVLLRKSLLFFLILISVTVILSLFASGTLTQALSSLFNATQRVSEGHFDIRVDVKSSDEVGALAENFNLMAAEVSRLLDQTAEKARMESELQTAKTVQETLFPETQSVVAGLEISGFYEPASECGGDWWHYCKVGDKVFLWIGDATGHGAPAALITSAAKSASSIIESLNVGPAEAMSFLNRAICEVARGRLMMTFFLASFDQSTGTMVYANASHEAPFLIKKGQGPLKKKDLIPLNDVVSPRLGQSKDTVYQEAQVVLEPGDSVFFYTDGIPDILSPKQESWGEREFIKALIASNKDYPTAAQSVSRFVKTFQAFRQGSQLIDDVTFFMVKNEVSEATENG